MVEYTMRQKIATHLAFEDGSARHSTSCPENGSISDSDPSINSPEPGEHLEAIIDEQKSDSSFVGAFQKDGRNRPVIDAENPDSDTGNPILAPLALGFLSGSGDARIPTALELSGENPDIEANPLVARLFPCAPVDTPAGERGIENSAMGDPVQHPDEKAVRATRTGRQASDRKRSVHAKWNGRITVSTRYGLAERLMPTRFAYGEPGWGMPHSEAAVDVCSAMFLAGVVRGATAAAGAATAMRVQPSEYGESFAFRSVETEAREIVLADGGPTETFVGNFSRRAVDCRAEFQALHGHLPETTEPSLPRASGTGNPPTRIGAGLGICANADSAR